MSNQKILKKLKQLEKVFSTVELFDIVQFVENYDGYIVYKDLPFSVKEYLKRLRVALAGIHLKPGDSYPPGHPNAYETLSREERYTINEAYRILERVTIKEGENVEPIPIH